MELESQEPTAACALSFALEEGVRNSDYLSNISHLHAKIIRHNPATLTGSSEK